MKRNTIRVGIATLAIALAARGGAKSHTLVQVASHVRIETASLTLADLLSANAPAGVRLRAAKIRLGAAPLPGNRRRLSRSAIESLLDPKLENELSVPASVVVERASSELSRQQVLLAIRAALVRNGFANPSALTPADVRFEMPVRVTTDDPGLKVLGMRIDPALRLAVFRLWTTGESVVRPFDVVVRPEGGLKPWLESVRGEGRPASHADFPVQRWIRTGTSAGTVWRARKPRPKPLVLPWQTASLLLISDTMEIHTTAEPLERGYLGQVIRVRVHKTRQVFRAKVVAPDCLEARF